MKKTFLMNTRGIFLNAAFASLIAFSSAAEAGFMKDFYNSAGSYQGNVTSAGVKQAASMTAVTGGGFVYRAPRKDFNAFYFTPPSLSAGCGGIDIFLGAFGIPSREEFVAFLRNIGTALPGLAFQLALQTLAPDLNEQVTNFRDLVRQYTSQFSDSCTAAESLLKMTGGDEWIKKLSLDAKSALRTSGRVSDESEADAVTRTDGSAVVKNAPTRKDSGGAIVDAPELNLTWALLSGGSFSSSYNTELKELMMSLVGTVIYTAEGTGSNTVTRATPIPGLDLVDALFGKNDSVSLSADAYRLKCADDTEQCLSVKKVALDDINIVEKFRTAAFNLRNSILQRNPDQVSDSEVLLLATATTIPLIALINSTASKRYLGFGADVLSVYAEAAAYEAITRALDRLALDIKNAIGSSSASQTGKIAKEHLLEIELRIKSLREDLARKSDTVFQQMTRAHSFVTQIEHLQKSLKAVLASDLAANISFKGDAI